MKKYLFVIMSIFLNPLLVGASPYFSNVSLDAFDVGNGGESLFCEAQGDEEVEFIRGRAFILSLDYLYKTPLDNSNLLYEPLPINSITSSFIVNLDLNTVDFNNNESLKNFINDLILENKLKPYPNESELRILKLLERNAPELYESLKNFLYYKLNFVEGKSRVWIPVDNLPNLHDEQTAEFLEDSHCKQPTQVVVRVIKNGRTYYFYSWREMIIIQHQKLQESFLFIHEWLWDFLNSAKQVSEVNWFLHSKRVGELSRNQFRSELAKYGFDLSKLTPKDPVVEQGWNIKPHVNAIKSKASSLSFRKLDCGDPQELSQQECIFPIPTDSSNIDPRFVKIELIKSNGKCFENQTWGLHKDASDNAYAVWTSQNCKARFRLIYFSFDRIETILF